MQQKIVITGGPGTGKTTLINSLIKKNYTCLPEISRALTLEARESGIDQLFLSDPLLFSKLLLEKRTEQFKSSLEIEKQIIFFDRGIPDIFAYLNFAKQSHTFDFSKTNKENHYTKVFITPPWEAIHTTDNERFETFEQTKEIHEHLVKTYTELNYNPILIPYGSIEERIQFILAHIE